ncbi:UNVERIFIED_CONTAM: Retrovirus-related Pol polyprotein from transposon TNT 1-94 [Sesamum radiatum]|uniref:Retrovirus-related Pol polyprotein from transposon TNT 1-94 n=1 Tax=Sesamum radiatum TaxID=300843 RepID=A0AAW2QI36_SESRA
MSDINSDKWLEAIKFQMDSMGSNQVWTLIDPPKGVRPVGCKWVYKHKLGANGEVTAFKARFVAKGYTQQPGMRFKLDNSKRGLLPMRHEVKLSTKQSPKTDEELEMMSNIPYTSTVGSIPYAIQCTKLDVAYALSVTIRYHACVGVAHWGAVKSILKYLKRTKDMFLIYSGGELILEGYSDTSFQSDNDDAKSQLGFVFKLIGGLVA